MSPTSLQPHSAGLLYECAGVQTKAIVSTFREAALHQLADVSLSTQANGAKATQQAAHKLLMVVLSDSDAFWTHEHHEGVRLSTTGESFQGAQQQHSQEHSSIGDLYFTREKYTTIKPHRAVTGVLRI